MRKNVNIGCLSAVLLIFGNVLGSSSNLPTDIVSHGASNENMTTLTIHAEPAENFHQPSGFNITGGFARLGEDIYLHLMHEMSDAEYIRAFLNLCSGINHTLISQKKKSESSI